MSYMDHARTSEAKMPLAEDRTDHYLQAVGGVMPGFAGHVRSRGLDPSVLDLRVKS